MTQNIATFDPWELIPLLKKRKKLFGGVLLISLGVVLFILLGLYLLLPTNSFYAQKVRVMLKKQPQTNQLIYPNGKAFSRQDIISAPVLKEVYSKNNLSQYIPQKEFQTLFSVSAMTEDQGKLDAEYAEKLNKRNLDIVNIQRLEEEYRAKRENLPANELTVTMQQSKLPPMLAEKVLSEIPLTWTEQYRKLESVNAPRTTLDSAIVQRLQQELRTSRLLAIDRAYQYSDQMNRLLVQLEDLQRQRNVTLPSGETLTTLRDDLSYLTSYQLNLMRQLLLEDAGLRSPMDHIFVNSKLQELQRMQLELQTKIRSLNDSMRILSSGNAVSGQKVGEGADKSQVIIDPGLFSQISALVADNVNNKLKKDIAELNLERGQELAYVESKLIYYQQLLEGLNRNNRTVNSSDALFNKMFESMTTDLATIGIKLNQFRRLLTDEYFSQLDFYIPQSTVSQISERVINIQRCALILLALWGLFNVVFDGVILWMDVKPRQEKR